MKNGWRIGTADELLNLTPEESRIVAALDKLLEKKRAAFPHLHTKDVYQSLGEIVPGNSLIKKIKLKAKP